MQIRKSIAIAAAGAIAVVGLGTTGAVADKVIGSKGIKQDAIKSKHIKDGTVKPRDLASGLLDKVNTSAKSSVDVQVAQLEEGTLIEKIGGPINDNNTDLDTTLTLAKGTYLVTVDGSFFNRAGALGADVYPQLSLQVESGEAPGFQWQQDGDISPNALLPEVINRHISVSGTTVLTLEKKTTIGLVAHGYTSTQGSQGSGQIEVDKATLTASKIG
ncbi:hypothetical protein [Nocardioides alcanivorans]|uniref:hypothetical protein n=1 Tax=Nocardioides alcanivorans TaxID=2897352 RepID=UPI001F43ED17|nr:hypothetical protein [Nocardioides alcanivorans]